MNFQCSLRGVVKRNGYFMVRLTVRGAGGRGSAPLALTVSKWENFDIFFLSNFILWYSKHILSHCEESQKCIFHYLYAWAAKAFCEGVFRPPRILRNAFKIHSWLSGSMEKYINQKKVPNFPKFHYLHFSFYPFDIFTSYFSGDTLKVLCLSK